MPIAPLRCFVVTSCLAALLCAAPAWAAKVNPDGTVAPAGGPEQAEKTTAGQAKAATSEQAKSIVPAPIDIIKKAAEAQADISPLTVKAMQHDSKALETVGRAPSNPASGGSRGAGSKSAKAMYGDIIIHK